MMASKDLGVAPSGTTKRRSRSSSRGRSVRSKRSSSRGRSIPSKRSSSRSRSRKRSSSRSQSRARSSSRPRIVKERPATPTRMSLRIAGKSNKEEVKESVKRPGKVLKHGGKHDTEFGGAIGTFFMTFSLPITVYYINLACNKNQCSIQNIPRFPTTFAAYFDVEAALIFLGWFLFQAFLYILPVGKVVMGQPQPIGNHARLPYRCNGFFAYVVSLLAFFVAVYMKVPVTKVYDKFLPLMTTAIVFSFALAIILYIKARLGPLNRRSPGGNTGNIIYDFFMGSELNPRIGSFDFKFFCEMRPGLIGWVMLNLVFVVKNFEQTGNIDYSLLLVTCFQALYIADALWFEDAILTTMDIVYEGFGLMLSFGDLAWVPFMYTLQGRFLLEHPYHLPWYCLVSIAVINSVGYYIFRASNSQKNQFRQNPRNPALANLETIPTKSGKKLLCSGWWGMCRKPNYLGDILMSTAWSMPCGFTSIIPWFYPVYFTILLIHRERRDDAICRKKYGDSWNQYCARVKYRIFPNVY